MSVKEAIEGLERERQEQAEKEERKRRERERENKRKMTLARKKGKQLLREKEVFKMLQGAIDERLFGEASNRLFLEIESSFEKFGMEGPYSYILKVEIGCFPGCDYRQSVEVHADINLKTHKRGIVIMGAESTTGKFSKDEATKEKLERAIAKAILQKKPFQYIPPGGPGGETAM